MSDNLIEAYRFVSGVDGPNLLITGGIHGNEPHGVAAAEAILRRFQSGDLKLKFGSITIIPRCNKAALVAGTRWIDDDLNRDFASREMPVNHEQRVMNAFAPYVDECDVLVDLHTNTDDAPPFVFAGTEDSLEHEEPLAASMGIERVVYNFQNAMASGGAGQQSVSMPVYARRAGAVAVVVECGGHNNPNATNVGIRAVEGALWHFGMVEGLDVVPSAIQSRTRMEKAIIRANEGAILDKWRHLDPIKSGDVIAHYTNGQSVVADRDGRIVLPNRASRVGQVLCYLGLDEPLRPVSTPGFAHGFMKKDHKPILVPL